MSDAEIEADDAESIEEYLTDGDLTYKGWRRAIQDGILVGQECEDCGHVTAAPKAACVRCGSESLTNRQLPTIGEVYTETTVAVSPEAFDGPYQVAIVSLEGESEQGARVMGMIDGEVDIGEGVELSGTIDADDNPGPVFEPT